MVGVTQTGIATNNVAGISPIPAYKDIVIALSVFVSCLINIKHMDHKRDENIIKMSQFESKYLVSKQLKFQ